MKHLKLVQLENLKGRKKMIRYDQREKASKRLLDLLFNIRWYAFKSQVEWDREALHSDCASNSAYVLVSSIINKMIEGHEVTISTVFDRRRLRLSK